MTAQNVNTLWGGIIADELAKNDVRAVVLTPGSRSTPITVALAEHPEIHTFSHLDERSAAFFALGRARRTGRPTPLVCTSGTALANFHPAVVEADSGRVPMLLLTADRPPELRDSGANQTIDQEAFYGDAVREYRTLPEPEAANRKLRSLRTAISRALAATTGLPAGPVHVNCPFRKPLAPNVENTDVPDGWQSENPLATTGRSGPFVRTAQGQPSLSSSDFDRLVEIVATADRGVIVCGPADHPTPDRQSLIKLASATEFPIFADPLSGLRFGCHVAETTVLGGYDAWISTLDTGLHPDVVLRFGASPTSKRLRSWLAGTGARQFVVDPAGGWREAEFMATDLAVVEPSTLATDIAARLDNDPGDWIPVGDRNSTYADELAARETCHWDVVAEEERYWEGRVLADVIALAPDPSTVFVSNSMPVRDIDRFARPRTADLTVLGNRGASGIDGVTSTALGAGSATNDPLVLVTGDLAYYHDANGLLAVERFDLDATIVLINNDGGGIFHRLPIADHDTFEGYFRTPHGLDFSPTSELYGMEFARLSDRDAFRDAFQQSVDSEGTQVLEIPFDAGESNAVRNDLRERVQHEMG